MFARSGTLAKESLSMDSVKRCLDFDSFGMETDLPRAPIWKTRKCRRSLDFGETDPSVRSRITDLLPDRIDFDSVIMSSKTIFTAKQKAELEAKFRSNKYPTRKEKVALAAKLDIGVTKVQTWFINRRRKWRKEQKKGAVGPSGTRPVLPGMSLIQTSCKQSLDNTVTFGRYPQFPAQLQVPFASASQIRITPSQQPQPVPRRPVATETGPLPYQQMYPPFPDPVHRFPQQEPELNRFVQQTAVPTYHAHHTPFPVNRVEPDFHQLPAVESRCITDEFPFSYSVAKDLPDIFGILEDGEEMDPPLTPSFVPRTGRQPLWEPSALQSEHFHGNPDLFTNEDFIDCVLRDHRYLVEPSSYSSCCYGNEMPSELSRGFVSKGRSFRFCRQD
ncbi:hypothetical protein ACROYT_G033864 [Oculina patagonica]